MDQGYGLDVLVSGWTFTVSQFFEFWYYIVPLGAGFGLQVALYTRLRSGDFVQRADLSLAPD